MLALRLDWYNVRPAKGILIENRFDSLAAGLAGESEPEARLRLNEGSP